MSAPGDTTPLEADIAALRKLRDDEASGALKEYLGNSEDPREWKRSNGGNVIKVKDGRVTMFWLHNCQNLAALSATIGKLGALEDLTLRNCSSLAMLPAAIGELRALTYLGLDGCSSLAKLPDAIGKLKALTRLNLRGCSSLEELPDAVAAREGLTVVLPDQLNGPLQEDFAALRKLRDESECDELKQAWSGEDPRGWRFEYEGEKQPCVQVDEDRVVGLGLSFSTLAVLPDAIGALGALTYLGLIECTSLVALPAAIGELKTLEALAFVKCTALTTVPAAISELGELEQLDLSGCSSLEKLPDTVAAREGLQVALPFHLLILDLPAPLREDFAALRKLRDDEASGALKEVFGDGEDPREWKDGYGDKAVAVEDGRVTKLDLYKCTKLTALPAAIGKLGALTTLDLRKCSSLAALPDAIGGLGALTKLDLRYCSKLAKLPDTIGKCGALIRLDLHGCSSLEVLPEGIVEREGLTIEFPVQLISGPLAKDFSALRKLRDDDASGALKEFFADDEDPREWKFDDPVYGNTPCVTVADGRVTKLSLYECTKLAALPAAIGELKALAILDLRGCSKLEELPDAVAAREGLTVVLPTHLIPGSLDEDFAALRKLRDDEASGALKEFFGDSEDPREWWDGDAVTVADDRVTKLVLYKCTKLTALPAAIGELGALMELSLRECSSLAELPAAIGKLKALTRLDLYECMKLAALPDAIGGLGALTTLDLRWCTSLVALPESIAGLDALSELYLGSCTKLTFPPIDTHNDIERVKRLLANTTHFLDDGLSAANADDDAKTDFLDSAIHHAPFADRLEEAVRRDPALADLTNAKGQRAIELACVECRSAMEKALMFLGRYAIADGPPEHRSATSLVVRALDAEAADDYGRLFDEFDKDSSGSLDADELNRLAAKLGTNVEVLKLDSGSLTKDAFVAKCQRLFGKERKVVIKIFQVEEQWRNELKSRDDQQLDARYVVQTIPAPTDEEFADGLKSSTRFGEGVGSRAIVMDAADRNLFQIYQSERPDLNTVRVLMRQVMECVDHVQTQGLVHGDIKMLNVVRLSLDNRLRLIDLDAAAKISVFGGDVSYVGSKFSSAVLPPECFTKLDADQVKMFEAYFSDRDAELREKVAPKVDSRGASYVVKTFTLTGNGAPKDGLPYELVEASVAIDYWSLGALLFELVAGETLVPSNSRDNDCVNGNAMAALASWNDDTAKQRLVAIKDAAAWDLASKLLIRDPDERAKFDIKRTLETHPFFNPKSGDVEILKQIDKNHAEVTSTLKSIDERTAAILSLSEENKFELQFTRRVLLKAAYEATEVTTPTAFVILKDKLKTKKELELAETTAGKQALERKEGEDDVVGRLEEAKTWTNLLAKFGRGVLKCSPSDISSAVHKACEELVVGEEMFLYLIDELTLEPVRPESEDDVYPIRITTPAEVVSKLLPAMQIGLYALSVVNGAAGIARLFGVPAPKVSDEWRAGVATSVEILKQKSSVEAFAGVHDTAVAPDGEEKKERTFRGAPLRDLKNLLEKEDKSKNFAGLQRIGDPSDGTAVWTLLEDPAEVKDALEKRAKERSEEETRSGAFITRLLDNAESKSQRKQLSVAEAPHEAADEPASPVTPPKGNADQSHVDGKPNEPGGGSKSCCTVA